MTKRQFIALADVMRKLKPTDPEHPDSPVFMGQYEQWVNTRDTLADFCAQQNDQFDRERWLGYIAGTNGKNGGKV